MERTPKAGEFYRHFKNNLYQIVTVAKHSETGEELVIYQALYGDYGVYARPLEMFLSEVDHDKYPLVAQTYRFEKVELGKRKGQSENSDVASSAGDMSGHKVEDDTDISGLSVSSETESQEAQPDPKLLEFLDADTYRERLNLLTALHPRITDEMINTMAVAVDVEVKEVLVNVKLKITPRKTEE